MAHKIIILTRSLFSKTFSKNFKHLPKQKCDGSQDYYIGSKSIFKKIVQKCKYHFKQKCDGSQDYYIGSKSVFQKKIQKVKHLHKQKCDGS